MNTELGHAPMPALKAEFRYQMLIKIRRWKALRSAGGLAAGSLQDS